MKYKRLSTYCCLCQEFMRDNRTQLICEKCLEFIMEINKECVRKQMKLKTKKLIEKQ